MTTRQKADKLWDWIEYEGTELGEMWERLVDLYNMGLPYGLSTTFWIALSKEIDEQYQIAFDMIDEGEMSVPKDLK